MIEEYNVAQPHSGVSLRLREEALTPVTDWVNLEDLTLAELSLT